MNNTQIARVNVTFRSLETGRQFIHLLVPADRIDFDPTLLEIVSVERVSQSEVAAVAVACDRFGSN